MKSVNIYSVPFLRERICRIRFSVLKRSLGIRQGTDEGVLHLAYSESHFKSYLSFKGRVNYLVNTLDSLLSGSRSNTTVLSVGPRFESELFGFRGLGLKWKNICAIDTFSYSPKISIGNMHSTNYRNSHFDFVVCGWTIAYSATPEVALNELARILKPGGKLVLTWDLPEVFQISDPGTLTLSRREDIDDEETKLPDQRILEMISSSYKIYRFEVGKLAFNGDTSFATLILEPHKLT